MWTKFRNELGNRLQINTVAILFSGNAPKSTADAHYPFIPNKNFYYFTGLTNEGFKLMLYKSENGLETTLFIEKPDYDIEKWVGRKLTKESAKDISGIEEIKYVEEFEAQINKMIYNNQIEKVFLDLEKISWDEADSKAHKFARELETRYPFLDIETLHPVISDMRIIKTKEEVELIKKAINLTQVGLNDVMRAMKSGMMEYQLESIFSHSIRMNGADGNAFPTIAASGGDAVILHYVENNKKINDGDLILLDLGAQYKQYCSDISRTYPVSGKFTERQKELYNIVLKAQEATIQAMKPGVRFEKLNEICKAVLTEELMKINLIEDESELSKYYYHGVSHYMGLDVHDLGTRDIELKSGMILTVEPGLYIAEENIGIRIEDDILITDDGYENLSIMIPKTTDDIEKIMKSV